MHKNFSFKGLVTSNDNILASEGECLELVNLRMVNGSLRPIPEPEEIASMPAFFSAVYWHDKASCYLCINESSHDISFYNSYWVQVKKNGSPLAFPDIVNVKEIEILGNLVCCITGNGIRYLLFSDGEYRSLGSTPSMPRLSITYSSKVHSLVTDSKFTKSKVDTEISSTWAYNARGYFDECISKSNVAGYYIDRALFRFALRLYDGSYIGCSHVIYVSHDELHDGLKRDAGNLIAEQTNASESSSTFKVMVLGFKPTFTFSGLQLKDWEGVVVGIDLFTTGSIMGNKIEEVTTTLYNSDDHTCVTEKYEAYTNKTFDEIHSEICDASLFYKIAEFDIYGNCLNSVNDVSQANLVLQPMLGSSDVQPAVPAIVPGCSYMFNNRLHLASLREYLFKGYNHHSVLTANGDYRLAETVVTATKIKTATGVSTVVNKFDNPRVRYNDGVFEFPPLFTYPDARAFEMCLYIYDDTELYMKRLKLTPHKYLNQSQYLHKWSLPYTVTVKAVFNSGATAPYVSAEDVVAIFNNVLGTHEVIYSAETGGWTYNGNSFPPDKYSSLRIFAIPRNVVDGDKLVFTITSDPSTTNYTDIKNIPYDSSWELMSGYTDYAEVQPYEDKPNVVKVSKVENPFVFPAKSVISLSQGNIIAMSTNITVISEGQFGQHPLYVFSSEGVSVLTVDTSGAAAYSSLLPVSNEVCRSRESVCGVDDGVIFHGSQGIMLITGNRCVKLSSAVDNDIKECMTLKNSSLFKDIANLYTEINVFAGVPFYEYVNGASVARDPIMNEILFCNPSYEYIYIYSLSNRMWSKLTGCYIGIVKFADRLTLLRRSAEGTMIDVSADSIYGNNNVILLTRPLLFGTKLHKRIMELMLHAYIAKPSGYFVSKPFFSCFLLGSNDGVNFKILSGCEKAVESQDVVFPYCPTCSYRYYMFAVSAKLSPSSMLTGLELEVSPAWSNRLG